MPLLSTPQYPSKSSTARTPWRTTTLLRRSPFHTTQRWSPPDPEHLHPTCQQLRPGLCCPSRSSCWRPRWHFPTARRSQWPPPYVELWRWGGCQRPAPCRLDRGSWPRVTKRRHTYENHCHHLHFSRPVHRITKLPPSLQLDSWLVYEFWPLTNSYQNGNQHEQDQIRKQNLHQFQ